MLTLLDNLLTTILINDADLKPLYNTGKVDFFFAVPNEDWAQRVNTNSQIKRVNIYLYSIQENRDVRLSNWETVDMPGQTSAIRHPPVYFDCHYRVTAWSPTPEKEHTSSPIPEEHLLLSQALRAFARNTEVEPAKLAINSGWEVYPNTHIYLAVAQAENIQGQGDFWTSMKLPWRPSIELVVTAPLDLLKVNPPDPQIVTLVQRYGSRDGTGSFDEVYLVGGWVLKKLDDKPISGASVQQKSGDGATTPVSQETKTDENGRFVFSGLRGQRHTFLVTAEGFQSVARTLDLPSATIENHIFRLS